MARRGFARAQTLAHRIRTRCCSEIRAARSASSALHAADDFVGVQLEPSPQRQHAVQTNSILVRPNDLRERTERFLSRLPDTDREIAFFRFYEEMPYGEISGITGVPVGSLKSKVHDIRKKLKVYLEGEK